MGIERLLDQPLLGNTRKAAATLRSIGFFAAPFIAGAVLLAYTINVDAVGKGVLAVITSATLTLATGAVLAFWYYLRIHFEPAPYEIIELEGIMTVEPVGGHHRYVSTVRQTVRATRDGTRLVDFRSHWIGRGSRNRCRVELLFPGHRLLDGGIREDDGRIHRWIYPGYALGKGEELDTGMRYIREDNLDAAIPRHAVCGGRYRVRTLTVITRFSMDEDPVDVKGQIWNNHPYARRNRPMGEIAVERKPRPEIRMVDYVVTVRRPRRHQSYGIRWTWPPNLYTSPSEAARAVPPPVPPQLSRPAARGRDRAVLPLTPVQPPPAALPPGDG